VSFNVNKLDVVFYQRTVDNLAYEQVNISGSSAIFYLDSNGILSGERLSDILKTDGTTKASLQSLTRPLSIGDTMYSVDTVKVGYPNRLTKYEADPNNPLSYKLSSTQTWTRDTAEGIGIGKSDENPNINATLDVFGNVIITGSLIVTNGIRAISDSAIFSSYSLSSSYSDNSITASYSNNATSASYSISSSYSINSISSSFASSSISSSYIDAGNITTGTLNNSRLPAQISVTGVTASFFGNLTGTASFASTADNLLNNTYNISVNYASQSMWATSASYASSSTVSNSTTGTLSQGTNITAFSYNGSDNATVGLLDSINLTNVTASHFSGSTAIINTLTVTELLNATQINITSITASFLGNIIGTASWASNSISSSYSINSISASYSDISFLSTTSITASSVIFTIDTVPAPTGFLTTIISLPTASFNSAFIRYNMYDNVTNRSGQLIVAYTTASIQYSDTYTKNVLGQARFSCSIDNTANVYLINSSSNDITLKIHTDRF